MRSSWKYSFFKNESKSIKNHFIISPNCLGNTIFLYNGKKSIKLKIQQFMIGYKFGNFIRTKKNYYGSKSKC